MPVSTPMSTMYVFHLALRKLKAPPISTEKAIRVPGQLQFELYHPQTFVILMLLLAVASGGCTEPTTATDSKTISESDSIRFTDITLEAGLGGFHHENGGYGDLTMPEIMGSGGGFLDYDGDGWLDIVLVGGGSLPGQPPIDQHALVLYRNQGDGTFVDATEAVGWAGERAYGFGVAAADYDNDGDEDVLLTTLGRNRFYRNEEGVFKEIGFAAGLADIDRWSTSAVFFDADLDGFLDLYIASYLHWTPEIDIACIENNLRDYCNPLNYRGGGDVFYRNNGDGTYTNRTVEAGFSDRDRPRIGKGLGVVELDYDQDGWPDLYVANDGEPNFLFKNDGDGSFSEVALVSGVSVDQNGTPRAGMGVDAGVVDSTGRISLFVGNFSEEMVGVWRLERDGFFSDRAASSRIGFSTVQTLTFGLSLFDVDLDTDLDLMLANGHVMKHIATKQVGVAFEEPAQLFLNAGDGTFEAARVGRPFIEPGVARGLAVGDIDQDGDLEVLMTENQGSAHLWRNDQSGGHFFRLNVEGRESNRAGVGVRIRATVDGLVMERQVRAGSSYLSQSEKTVTFGVGAERPLESIEVHWPGGRVDRFEDVAPDRHMLLIEGAGELVPAPMYRQ